MGKRSKKRGLRLTRWLGIAVLSLFVISALPVVVGVWVDPPTSAFMERARAALSSGPGRATIDYQWIDYERIAPAMRLAAVASEDQKFPRHFGFDWSSIRDAVEQNRTARRPRGASTITQQVAKNLLLWPGRTYLRKGLEAYFTVLIETVWSKQRILEVYLNIVQFDSRVFGVEAASRRFFNKPARALKPAEAALLAAVLPAPSVYRVEAPSAHVRKRQNWILDQMRRLGSGYLRELQ